ncbi:hypothetical protein DFQ28_010319 [Apophysomyces sp. BC1034]|nr:hypothetical protein DFQ30_010181 [Apophysomyces sp. BC1015]KAG0177355.1 hypothetical protein DFQ29_004928 [Apophysomyces sp. BC1021]KAG0192048.1 hypothetical protein DFQ28_010319 [Apophysomyces sp. BC1034]
METNQEIKVASMSKSSSTPTTSVVPEKRRDRLREIGARYTTYVLNEFHKFYSNPPTPRPADRSLTTPAKRTDTQTIDDILENSVPDSVKPQCMLFPTYASHTHVDGEIKWKVDVAGWTFAIPGSSRLERFLLAAGRTYGGLMANSAEDTHFTALLNQFRCQTMKEIDVQIRLGARILEKIQKHDDLEHKQKHDDIISTLVNSGPSGRFEQTLLLNPAECQEYIKGRVLRLEALFDGIDTPNPGFVDLIEPTGISVISDIDDTIKITDVPDGSDAILRNTFFRQAREVPGMSDVYRNWAEQGASVHYVSNGPWQVFPALQEFFKDTKFPKGSMHLRVITTQDLLLGKPKQHKLEVIPKIFQDFPNRKFILVGDSGEYDPEIYQEIYARFPSQVAKIFIHDVTSERAMTEDRRKRDRDASDSYYNSIRKFLVKEESHLLRRTNTGTHAAMDAMTRTEIPSEQEAALDPEVPPATKLELFEQRMERVSAGMPEGMFTVFKLASQLLTDPVMAEEFMVSKRGELGI